jgi:hypothetical protein
MTVSRPGEGQFVTETNLHDVDLYLTVARNLIASGGVIDADLAVDSHFGQNDRVREILSLIDSRQSQYPGETQPTQLYGGQRYVDYSQFRPRAHYAKVHALRGYFQCSMWLSRVDCGWSVMESSQELANETDVERELGNAVLLAQLLRDPDALSWLQQIDALLGLLVGAGDGLSALGLVRALQDQGIASDLTRFDTSINFDELRIKVAKEGHGLERIRSRVVISNPDDAPSVMTPQRFQVFGQRFTVDSAVLSNVVYDAVVFENRKVRRMLPTGLDVIASLGNNAAFPLLESELADYHYASNLAACRDFVEQQSSEFWDSSLYNIWLNCIRSLNDDMTQHPHAPEVMKTHMWQRKQLQTQLAAWSELRHDMLLYAKQSYTGGPGCEYPTGYVEPYPEFYEELESFADQAATMMRELEPASLRRKPWEREISTKSIVEFFERCSTVYRKLKTLARKELAAEEFSKDEQLWLKQTISRFMISGPPSYSGWYCDLYYRKIWDVEKWCPTVTDVHTDPQSNTVLHAAVGNPRFCVVAIDSERDRSVFVGPIYSYFEFLRPSPQRLDDGTWREMIKSGQMPPSPRWVGDFQGPPEKRPFDRGTASYYEYVH